MKKTLYLTLKKKWFDMIDSGEKTEEYRDLKEYWIIRLGRAWEFDKVEFRHGYSRQAKKMQFIIKDIYIGHGREDWGALPKSCVFVIELGQRLHLN